jgi:hypothetical protein
MRFCLPYERAEPHLVCKATRIGFPPMGGLPAIDKPRGVAMQNLAGNVKADEIIKQELILAGIPIVGATAEEAGHSEVPFTLAGQLGQFRFTRAWYYWMVKGNLPLEAAEKLYDDPVARQDVRAGGDCGRRSPLEWACWLTDNGKKVLPTKSEAELRDYKIAAQILDEYVFGDDPASVGAKRYVTHYHIDSADGLRLFADMIRSIGLDRVGA